MRHSAITFAESVEQRIAGGEHFDLIFCSDMLNLAEFKGLAKSASGIPAIIYFHENQLTYPSRFPQERDYQYVLTNFTSALSADAVWFNSKFHKDEFISAMREFLQKMPDNQPVGEIEKILTKSNVVSPGINDFPPRPNHRQDGPVRILWAGRWEHDKNPADFFVALKIIKAAGIDFRLSVIGESFKEIPEIFEQSRKFFASYIDHWGYQQSRADYEAVLAQADIIVSTAIHEFFGIGVVEAAAAGVYPLLPRRLAYPEIFGSFEEFFYDGTVEHLASQLSELARKVQADDLWPGDSAAGMKIVERFKWKNLAPLLDEKIRL